MYIFCVCVTYDIVENTAYQFKYLISTERYCGGSDGVGLVLFDHVVTELYKGTCEADLA